VFTGSAFFSILIFSFLKRIQNRLMQRNRQIAAVHSAGISLASEMQLEPLLLRLVDPRGDHERPLRRAGHRAHGRLDQFITSGLSEEIAAIGPPPKGEGLLGVMIHQGASLRLPGHQQRFAIIGFPPRHPAMRTLPRRAGRLQGEHRRAALPEREAGSGIIQQRGRRDGAVVRRPGRRFHRERVSWSNRRTSRSWRNASASAWTSHDGVIQSLYGVGLNLEDCADVVADDPAIRQRALDKAVNDLNQVKDIRSYIFHLRPAAFDSNDLSAA
jgi:hypothetical protein